MYKLADKPYVTPSDIIKGSRALRAVGKDPDRTDLIADFIAAFTGPSVGKLFDKIMADPIGRKLLEERRDLLKTLSDHKYLSSLPEGSLGKMYYDWVTSRGYQASGLVNATDSHVKRDLDSEMDTMGARVVDMHDIWHVINGWDSDMMGEMHLLGYSYAQLGSFAWLFLALMFNFALVFGGRFDGVGCMLDAIRKGWKADLLSAVDWEAMLPLPVEEVRQKLNIEEPKSYTKMYFEEFQEICERSLFVKFVYALPAW